MLRTAAGKVMWVGRATVFLVGLSVILALVFGVATSAMGANGQAFVLGKLNNAATAVTGLVGNVDGGAALRVTNPNSGINDTALDLRVQAGEAPMRVNSAGKVANLNADQLDGKNSSELQGPRAYAHINADGTLDLSRSKNVDKIYTLDPGVYCINSTVPPSNVIATIVARSGGPGMIYLDYGEALCTVNTPGPNQGTYNIVVQTFSSTGTAADRGFNVAIN